NQRPCRGVIHLWSLDDPLAADLTAATIDTIQERACGSALYLTQALASAGLSVLPSLTLVTRGVQDVAAASSPSGAPGAGMLGGLGRAVALEHPELRFTCIDIDPAVTDADLRSLYETVATGESDENQIALRAGKSYALRLVRSPVADAAPAASADASLICREDRTYLVT